MMRAAWHPVALCPQIEPGTSAGVVADGVEIALWRDTKGVIHAWEDRCPHRGMKLSFGFVRGDHIACLYHGWEYGADGRCQRIPAHPALAVPASICVRTYRVAEAAGMVWVCLADNGAEADAVPQDQDGASVVRSLYVDCALTQAVALLQSTGNSFGAVVQVAGAVALLDTDLGRLRIGLHSVGPARCALHITMAGQASAETLTAIAHRAEAFRRLAEGAGA